MSSPAERSTDWARSQLAMVTEQVNALGLRLSSWLVLGNAGALVIAYNALLQGTNVPAAPTRLSIVMFSIGLMFSFAGLATSYAMSSFGMFKISSALGLLIQIEVSEHYIGKLESEGISVAADAPLRKTLDDAGSALAPLNRSIRKIWWGTGVAIFLQLIAALSFAYGVLAPAFQVASPS